jgi:hypothetical protein
MTTGAITSMTASYTNHIMRMIYVMKIGMPQYMRHESVYALRKELQKALRLYTDKTFDKFWDGFENMSADPIKVPTHIPESIHHIVQQNDALCAQTTHTKMTNIIEMVMSENLGAVRGADGQLSMVQSVEGKLWGLLSVSLGQLKFDLF